MRPRPSPSETDIISHIKFIAQDLFQEPSTSKHSPYKYSPFSTLTKTIPSRLEKSDSIEQCHCYHKIKHQIKAPHTEPSKKSNRHPIFQNFEQYWSEIHKQRQQKDKTPIIQRINKNIYSRFQTDNKDLKKLADPQKKQKKQGEEIWREFLNREDRWIDQKKRVIRETQLADQARLHSFSHEKHRKKASWSPQRLKTTEWSLVEEGIRELKNQTERLRSHILLMNQEQKKNPGLAKTFQSRRR